MKLPILLIFLLILSACGDGGVSSPEDNQQSGGPQDIQPLSEGDWYRPTPLASWQWQLSGDIDTGYEVEIYDIDLFDTPVATIEQLQSAGRRVICYFSAGSYEQWRDDASQFDDADLGNTLDGWPGERWLDVRSDKLRTIMQSRLDLARDKGCDGVEPDNVDGYQNNSGHGFGAADQLDYNRFIANEAHQRGLSVGLKNDLDQVDALVDYVDFAVNEQCFEYDECDLLAPFVADNKAILNTEYRSQWINDADARNTLCGQANGRQISTLVLALELDDSFRFSCF